MGCDIHAFVEIKVDGEWLLYSQPQIERDYHLFAYMAGVRTRLIGVKPIVEPRGFPETASKVVRLARDYWAGDGHTHSWLTPEELGKVFAYQKSILPEGFEQEYRLYEQWGYLFGISIWYFNKYRDNYPDFIQDVRLIFWFDN